jgi:hypothetical protein
LLRDESDIGVLSRRLEFCLQLFLSRLQSLAQRAQIHAGLLGLRKHTAGLLFLLDVMFDHFREYRDFGTEEVIIGGRALDLGYELLGARVFDQRLVMGIPILCAGQKRGIKDFLFNDRMDGERVADLIGQLLLFGAAVGFGELREPLLDLLVVRLQ